jgi:penicillin amidase
MRREDVVIGLPKGKSLTLPLYLTEKGPVITAVEKGVEAVAVLKWYGTLPQGAVQDHTYRGVFSFMKATTAAEVLDAGRHWAYATQNLVAADDQGHIGWHAFGAVPIRNGYSGRVPADGTAGADWKGFLPYESLPQSMDPAEGWLANANNAPPGWSGPPLSYSWAPPYRYDRIAGVLRGMSSPGVEDFRRLQADVHSLQADRILPRVLSFSFSDEKAGEAARILREWDHQVRPESRGAAVYEVFLDELDRMLLSDRLGDDFALYLNAKSYGIEDEILDRPDSPFWDRKATMEKETMGPIVEAALANAMGFCRKRMGRNTKKWSWGQLHGYMFEHPGATNPLFAILLNRGPYPAPGDDNTVNVSWSLAERGSYKATTIPSMRMIAALGNPDGLWLSGPLGQSGQPGHPHYDDLMKLFLAGEQAQVPLSAEAVKKVTKEVLLLRP